MLPILPNTVAVVATRSVTQRHPTISVFKLKPTISITITTKLWNSSKLVANVPEFVVLIGLIARKLGSPRQG